MIVADRIVQRLDELITKGNQVLATHRPNPPNVIGFPTLDSGAFAEWQAQVQSLLINLLTHNHTYVQKFEEKVDKGFQSCVKAGQGILRAMKEDILGGYLTDVKTLISAEIFTDFLDLADHLMECNYKDPAASLCGAVLENGLRQIASNAGLTLKAIEGLASLNRKCTKAEVYNTLIHKRIQVWTEIRNNADHGQFNNYSEQDVKDMLKEARRFLEDHLR